MSLDAKFLEYSHDEENLGFGEPEPRAKKTRSVNARVGLALVGAGLGVILGVLIDVAHAGSWGVLFSSFGALGVGAALFFWQDRKDTNPGILHDGVMFGGTTARGAVGWALGVLLVGFYVTLYWWPRYLGSVVRIVDPLAMLLSGKPADHWFLYGFLYTMAVLVFGVRFLMKYRHNRYMQVRTASVMFFQLGFAFLIPNLLKMFHQPEFYFTYFWPLKWNYLWPADHGIGWILDHPGRLGVFFVAWGAVMSFAAVPVLTYFFGKRWYCSWVCGCGALAETLGDPWRQLSDKSTRAWIVERWLIHSVLLLIIVTTALLWIDYANGHAIFGSLAGDLAKFYGFWIGALFAGVVGVGFYPVMGSRVWCRFGCPQAAILGFFQRFASRFRITTNGGQCMSCGNCSTYCEMGIDVRAYAMRGENIVRSSCVGCGVCSAVCPRGVLKLEGGAVGDRYEGADRPLESLKRALSDPGRPRL